MKKLLCIIFLVLTNQAYAAVSDIVALVNNDPITRYEFESRKKMIILLNKIPTTNANLTNQLNSAALNTLIDEQLLFQHSKKYGIKISKYDIDSAIAGIDDKNQKPKGFLENYLKANNIDVNTFQSQIKAELIKLQMMSSISRSVSVSPKEVDSAILLNNVKDIKISAKLFTSLTNDEKAFRKMQDLQKRLSKVKDYSNIKESTYKDIASLTNIEDNISTLDGQLKTVVKDLETNKPSNVFHAENGFKIVVVSSKESNNLTTKENNYVINFLSNKKMGQKMQKFLLDLRKKAYIKIMLPSA